jgi:polar amino acid transport system substrate-binding protein
VDEKVLAALAPTGVLRAGINLSNFLLVSQTAANGDPEGVSPSMASALAERLGVDLEIITFDSPGQLADAATKDIWDIGNIGAESKRAEHISFSAAYCEIDCTYLVPAGSPIKTLADVDQPGVRIATKARAAYSLFLEENLKHASLVQTESIDDSFDRFVSDGLEALAGLKPRLLSDVDRLDGAVILDGRFRAVQQAIGTPRSRGSAGADFLGQFVEEAKSSGLVASLIDHHQVQGLSVAPPA